MDPRPLTVVAVFRARAGSEHSLRAALTAMVGPSRNELDCVTYDLHTSIDDPGLFFFCETWRTAAAHADHLETAHVRHLLEISPSLLSAPILELKGRQVEA